MMSAQKPTIILNLQESTHKLSTTGHQNLPQNASTANFSERKTSVQMTSTVEKSDICSSSPDEDELLEEKPVFEENPILEHIVACKTYKFPRKSMVFCCC